MLKSESELLARYCQKYPGKNPQGLKTNLAGLNSRQFSNFLNAYAKYFNLKHDRKGSLFLDNVERKLIKDAGYFLRALNYIQFNPVHHGMVKDIRDYPFTSWHAFASNRKTKINRELAYKLLPENCDIRTMPGKRELLNYALEMDIGF